jgi:hypothetical protein
VGEIDNRAGFGVAADADGAKQKTVADASTLTPARPRRSRFGLWGCGEQPPELEGIRMSRPL